MLSRLLPPPGIARNLAFQSMIYATGNGVFMAGSAVFFVHVVGLRPTQVGIGLSVAGAVSLVLSVPVGMLVDRVGSRRTWMLAALAEAALFGGYPFVRGFWPFLAVVAALAVTGAAGNAGRTVYTIEAVPQEQRVRVLAFSRSALNIGFTVGALGAGVALAVNTRPAYYAMVLTNAVGLLVNAYCILRLPAVAAHRADRSGLRFAALRDRPFLAGVPHEHRLSGLDRLLQKRELVQKQPLLTRPLEAVADEGMDRPALGIEAHHQRTLEAERVPHLRADAFHQLVDVVGSRTYCPRKVVDDP